MRTGNQKYKTGTFHKTKHGELKIIEYINAKNVAVRFVETGYVSKTTAIDIKRGSVKDYMRPSVYGVGYLGAKVKTRGNDGKMAVPYIRWSKMLERCYCIKRQAKQPSYIGSKVCDEWHNFQNF